MPLVVRLYGFSSSIRESEINFGVVALAPYRAANLSPKNLRSELKSSNESLGLVIPTQRDLNLAWLIKDLPINLDAPRSRRIIMQPNECSAAMPVVTTLWAVRSRFNCDDIGGSECL